MAGTNDTKAMSPARVKGVLPFFDVRAHGAVGDGVADDTAAIQAAIDAACGSDDPATTTRVATHQVAIPAGVYLTSSPLRVQSVLGLEIVGYGNVEIKANANMTSVFDINGAAYSRFGGFTITGAASVQVDNAFYAYWDVAEAARSMTRNSYHDIQIRNLDYIVGMRIGKPGVGAVQVDNDEFRNIGIYGGWTTGDVTRWQQGLYLGTGTAGNNLLHHVYNASIASNRYNIYVDLTQIDLQGAGLGTGEVDVYLGIVGYSTLTGIRSEGSERFLLTGGPSSASPMISISDIQWHAEHINADNKWIRILAAGSVVARNISILSTTATPKIELGSGNPVRMSIDGFQVGGNPVVAVADNFTFATASSAHVHNYACTNSSGGVQYVNDWEGPGLNTQTGTTYTFVSHDAFKVSTFSNASAITATIPPNSSVVWPVGTRLAAVQTGAGVLSLAAGVGVTVNGNVRVPAQYRRIVATKTATDTWVTDVNEASTLLAGAGASLLARSGEYWSTPGTRTTAALTAGVLYTHCFFVPFDCTVDRIGAEVTTLAAASTLSLGIYSDDAAGLPGAVLLDAGTIDGGSATAQEITVSQALTGGTAYHFAVLCQGGTPTMRTMASGWNGHNSSLANALTGAYRSGRNRGGFVGTALPGTAGSLSVSSGVPVVAVRLV